jgi:hypothetical protein
MYCFHLHRQAVLEFKDCPTLSAFSQSTRRTHNKEEVDTAIRKWLRMEDPDSMAA